MIPTAFMRHFAFLLVLLAALVRSHSAGAATFVVTNTTNSGAGSLRAAIASANEEATSIGPDTIVFAPGLSGQTVGLNTVGDTSFGPWLRGGLARGGGGYANPSTGGFGGGNSTNSPRSGSSGGGAGMGGAIFNNGGAVTLINSTFSGNTAQGGTRGNAGSGLFSRNGSANINSRTFNTNTSAQGGGAFESGSTEIVQSGPNFVVTNTGDTDNGCTTTSCSLREAIGAANAYNNANSNAGTQINFASSATGTVTLLSVLPNLSTNIILTGPGAKALTVTRSVASGTANFRIFTISNGTLTGPSTAISGLTMSHGNSNLGGGIRNEYGTLTLSDCTIKDNSSSVGGGIYSNGFKGGATLTLSNCTLGGNSASQGGGIFNDSELGSATVKLSNCTLSGNSASDKGGGIFNYDFNGRGTVTISSSTLSGNSAPNSGGGIFNNGTSSQATVILSNSIINAGASGANLFNLNNNGYVGTIISQGYNLSSDDSSAFLSQPTDKNSTDPKLDNLKDIDGPTPTHALLPGSPAINAGSTTLTTDQRGVARDSTPDMGAYEFVNVAPVVSSLTPSVSSNVVGETRAFTVTVSDANGASDIKEVWFMANTRLDWSDGATLLYLPASNQLFLRDNDHFTAPITPGGTGTLSNTGVTIDASTVSVSTAGNSVSLSFSAQIKNGLIGTNKVWVRVADQSGATDPAAPAGEFGNVQKGIWTVSGTSGAQVAPTIALSPGPKGTSTALSVGTEFTLGVDLSDGNGVGDLASGYVLINAPGVLDWGGFTLYYEARNNRLYLRSSDGSTFLGGQVVGQGTGTLENESGGVRLAGCTATPITNGVHLSIPVTFKAPFTGTQQVWSRVQDVTGATAISSDSNFGFTSEGTFSISNAQEVAPTASVQVAGQAAGKGTTTALASGSETSFTLSLRDGNGAGQLKTGWLLINTPGLLDWTGAIALVVDTRTNTLYLRSSDGQSWNTAQLTSSAGGATGTLSNDAVSVRLSGCTLTRVSQGFDLVVTATPKAAFAGTKQMWSRVQDSAGNVQANNDATLGFNTEGQLIINPVAPASSEGRSGGNS